MLKPNRNFKLGLAASGKMMTLVALAVVVAWAALDAAGRELAFLDPKTLSAYGYFRADYARASDKGSFLRGYRLRLVEHGGGYTPALVDAFLCERLQHAPRPEAIAIADFYVVKAAGREGIRIMHLPAPAPARERIVGLVLSRISSYEAQDAMRAFILMEEVRGEQELFKSNIILRDGNTKPDWETWWRHDGIPRARRAFEVWWKREEPWPQKERRDPLSGTGLEATSL